MFLFELVQVAEYINENANGSYISNVYRSFGGTLLKLYGARLSGIYFNTSEKVLIPVSDLSLFKKEQITGTEEGLRANFTNKVKRVSVLEQFGKVVKFESVECDLIVPLFNGRSVFVTDRSGNVLWNEKKESKLELLKEPMKHFEPSVESPQLWEKLFFEIIDKKKAFEKDQFIEKKRRKLQKLVDNLREQTEKYRVDIEKYGRSAPLIKINLSMIDPKEKTKNIELFDYNGEKNVVALDPSRTIIENMEIFFGKIRKARTGIDLADKKLKETLIEIEQCGNGTDSFENQEHAVFTKKIKQNFQHKPYHEFHSEDGRVFFVGKDAHDNDELTFKIASPHDMWFHAKDYQGSHVVMKMKKGEILSGKDLMTGCVLALFYSKAKNGMSGEVWYTERKNITKKKGLSTGKVIVKNGKVKYINGGVLPENLKKIG